MAPYNSELVEIKKINELADKDPFLAALFAFCDANGMMYKTSFDKLATFLAPYVTAVGGSGFVATTGTVLPAASPGKFTIVGGPATFTQTTGGNVVTTQLLNVLASSATTWSISAAIPLPNTVALKTDLQYRGVFDTTALALAGVPLASRKVGDTVIVKDANGNSVEYWWKTVTTDAGLVIKSSPQFEVISSTGVLFLTDVNGYILGSYDSEGKFTTNYKGNSIPNSALIPEIEAFFKGAGVEDNPKFLRLFADSLGSILGGIKADGTLYFKSIEAESYLGNIVANQTAEITTETMLNFDYPNSLVEVHIDGILPTDQSDARASTNVIVTFYKDNTTLFKCNGKMAIQGHGSVNYAKKGYELDFTNASGKAIMIKWGHLSPVDAINFKAFHSDPTHTRDISAGRTWHQIRTSRPFPSSFIADFTADTTTNNTKYRYYDDALFYPDGFPMRMTANGAPFGLYTWRMKKKRENYRMDSANKANIFLDGAVNTGFNFTQFNYAEWDLKSPKLSGYNEAGPINDATVLASINRYFNWIGACLAGTTDMRATYQDYINLDSVIDYIITCELIASWDANNNNVELMTWDGLRWSYCIYDQDHTAGIWYGDAKGSATSQVMTGAMWAKFKSVFLVEMKARYTELRNNGIISMNNLQRIYSQIPKTIPTDVYIENLSLWGWSGQVANWQTSLRDILDFLNKKIAYLDTFYKNN